MHDLMSRFNPKEDDISLFLVLFERQAKIMNIPAENQVAKPISLLPPDIVQLIAREPEEDAKKYFVKKRFTNVGEERESEANLSLMEEYCRLSNAPEMSKDINTACFYCLRA
ncbi:hypothetical protein AVEN_79977-1 [Araneus ventricosus]|uniref:Uncharacterized protein n=1 Tax=Araneus ventricosus TaxID=182803 RepID=A0A4Y2QNS6_ARAVE|nr:hypothetical protein AVEN_79977-1 [Araneus ventricosus]